MSNLNRHTLLTLFSVEGIKEIRIPIIQRDFAYGRNEEGVNDKRKSFVGKLRKRLVEDDSKIFRMDFVYGRVDKDKIFYPIDGQQRLTTLYLLHLYLYLKEPSGVGEDNKRILEKFHYESRINADDFLTNLINSKIDISNIGLEKNGLINCIKNCNWYRKKWDKDATVSAMLVMLQTLHEYFWDSNDVWKKLNIKVEDDGTVKEGELDKSITFYFLDLGSKDFNLTDELYVKMNARGKQLTKFENFKASFIEFLEDTYPKKAGDDKLSLSEEFKSKIEQEWTDLFWAYRDENYNIDTQLINYFEKITQLLYYSDKDKHKSGADDFKFNKDFFAVYKKEENVRFLFSSLDLFYKTSYIEDKKEVDKKIIENFFEKAFAKDSCNLFWNASGADSNNLFKLVLFQDKVKLELANQIMLYLLIKFCLYHKYEKLELTQDLKDFLRIVRNLISNIKQKKETILQPNVRINHLPGYIIIFNKLVANHNAIPLNISPNEITVLGNDGKTKEKINLHITQAYLNDEQIKLNLLQDKNQSEDNKQALIALENMDYFRGALYNLFPETNFAHFSEYYKILKELYDSAKTSKDVSRDFLISLIGCGYKGIYIRKCASGKWSCYHFWDTDTLSNIFTITREVAGDASTTLSSSLLKFFQKYKDAEGKTVQEKLNNIKQKSLADYTTHDWEYYFLKYADFLNASGKLYYYAWLDKGQKNKFKIHSLNSDCNNPTLAYHSNLYIYKLAKVLPKGICNMKLSYSIYAKDNSLYLNAFKDRVFFCCEKGWKIEAKYISKYETLLNTYKDALTPDGDFYYLRETDDKDRIEIGKEFLIDLNDLVTNK